MNPAPAKIPGMQGVFKLQKTFDHSQKRNKDKTILFVFPAVKSLFAKQGEGSITLFRTFC